MMGHSMLLRHRLFGACLLLMPMFTGCAWIPAGDKPAQFLTAPAMHHALSGFGSDETAALARQWPAEQWWHEFGSPELNRLMSTALSHNPGLKAAIARVRKAEALARVEGARLLPFLDADAEVAYERISGHGIFAALNRQEAAGAHIVFGKLNLFNLRYEFDFWGKNRSALAAALGEAAAEKAEHADVILKLTGAIARAYFRGSALRQQLELVQTMTALQKDLLAVHETRLRLGLASADPVKEATIALEQERKREALIREQLDVQHNVVTKLMGSGPDAAQNLFVDKISNIDEPTLPAKLPLELLRRRPDLVSALSRAEAAAHRIKVAKASFLPTLDLTAFAGVNALRLTKGASSLANILFSGSSVSYGIAPGLRLPWFEGGRLRAELSAQRAEYNEAVELYNDTLLTAIQEIADSLNAWKETGAIIAAHVRLLKSQRNNQDLAEDRFRTGLNDRRELLERQHEVLNQQYVLKSLEAGHLTARVDLIEALGGGYSNDLKAMQGLIRMQPSLATGLDLFKWLKPSQPQISPIQD